MASFLSYEGAKKWSEELEEQDLQSVFLAPVILCILSVIAFFIDPLVLPSVFSALAALMPLWLPIYLARILFISLVDYNRFIFWFSQQYILLEITLPPEIEKSQSAMEVFLTAMWNIGGETTWLDRIFFGKFRAIWTLEIASNEGRLSYHIYLLRVWKNTIEARLYGQFPEAHIEEVDDYVDKVPFTLEEYDIFGMEYDKPEPQALPIKTYITYELDKNTDAPETRVDPLTHVLELFGSVGKDEYLWLQIIMRARKNTDEWHGLYKKNTDSYRGPAAQETKSVTEKTIMRSKELDEKLKLTYSPFPQATEAEKRRVDNIQRSLSKLTFECGIRSVYLAKKDRFSGVNISALVNIFTPLRGTDTSVDYNSLNIAYKRGLLRFNYPWQDFMDILHNIDKRNVWHWYKHRSYFYVPYNQTPIFLSTEELATLWHFPNSAVQTPGLRRVPSRTVEAPPNLPT